jgi:glycerol-3-phosphate acyltransferase PlsY
MAPRLGFGLGTVAAAGLASFVGHLYPVFFRFQGGKGVATAAGVLLAFNVWLGLLCLGTWLVVALATRYSSLAALVTAVLAPIFDVVIWGPTLRTDAVAAMSLLLVWRHRANIGKLLSGTESKLGARAAKPSDAPSHSNDSRKDPQ